MRVDYRRGSDILSTIKVRGISAMKLSWRFFIINRIVTMDILGKLPRGARNRISLFKITRLGHLQFYSERDTIRATPLKWGRRDT
jgi:hypothetical protein